MYVCLAWQEMGRLMKIRTYVASGSHWLLMLPENLETEADVHVRSVQYILYSYPTISILEMLSIRSSMIQKLACNIGMGVENELFAVQQADSLALLTEFTQ